MLTNLHVKNIALIDEIDIDFENGLTILSGETGAGKSIILGSIAIALGLRTPGDIVREGADHALTQLSFYFSDKDILARLEELGVEDIECGDVIIQRKILSGRSQFKINGINASAGQVKEIAPFLLDLHAQRDNLLLLKEENQMELVDSFSSEGYRDKLGSMKDMYDLYRACVSELTSLDVDEAARERELDLLRYEIKELEEADLKAGEDAELEEKFSIGENSQKIMEGLSRALDFLSYGNENASDTMAQALKNLGDIASYDNRLADIYSSLSDADTIIADVARDLSDYADECEMDEEEFSLISRRLDLYNHLKSKYNTDVEGLLSVLDESYRKLQLIENADIAVSELKERIVSMEKEMKDLSDKISSMRRDSAERLSVLITEAARDLNFNDIRFEIRVERTKDFGPAGGDRVSYLMSTNPGEDLKALDKVASGGELSRIMLAIKTVAAKHDSVETLIFDEIDTGISGRTAQRVGEKMAELADDRQIICITHLPQIAAMADYHFLIAKTVNNGKTITDINRLSEEESVKELSRILGGSQITDTVIKNAREMKDMADAYKKVNRN